MRPTANDLFRAKYGRDLPNTDPRSPHYDYKAKLAARRKASKNFERYIEACKKLYPFGSQST